MTFAMPNKLQRVWRRTVSGKTPPLLLCGLLFAAGANADVAYVDDQLVITMRSGESSQHSIIRTLKSGTRLDILESHKETGYSLARLGDGTEGYVLNQYLSPTPIARQRLAEAEKKSAELEKELAAVKSDLKQTSSARQQLDKSSVQLSGENEKLKKELQQIREISKNAIVLNDDNKTLREKMIRMETEMQALEQQNSVLKDRSNRDWFITGTGVTVLGVLIGLLVPKLRLGRKSKWNEL
jgi:SH3 domain protein